MASIAHDVFAMTLLLSLYRDVFKTCFKNRKKNMLFGAPRPSQVLPEAKNNMPDTLRRSPMVGEKNKMFWE